jgi:hypothetical protein
VGLEPAELGRASKGGAAQLLCEPIACEAQSIFCSTSLTEQSRGIFVLRPVATPLAKTQCEGAEISEQRPRSHAVAAGDGSLVSGARRASALSPLWAPMSHVSANRAIT